MTKTTFLRQEKEESEILLNQKIEKIEDKKELALLDFEKEVQEITKDISFKGIIARALGKNFEEREFINSEDIKKLITLMQLDQNLEKEVEIKLIPIMKRGKKWEDKESRRLRKKYFEKNRELFRILSKFEFKDLRKTEEILLLGDKAFDKSTAYLDFPSAVSLIDKAPRKKSKSKITNSTYFRESFNNNERLLVFGVFDSVSENPSLSSLAARLWSEKSKNYRKEDGIKFLENVTKELDREVGIEIKSCGINATFGIVENKEMSYVNLGGNKIYGIEKSGKIESLFKNEEIMPLFYLGCFTQKIKGKSGTKYVQTEFKLTYPYIGKMNLNNYNSIIIVSEIVWKCLKLENEQEEKILEEIIKRAQSPISIVERINIRVKNILKQIRDKEMLNDLGILYFYI